MYDEWANIVFDVSHFVKLMGFEKYDQQYNGCVVIPFFTEDSDAVIFWCQNNNMRIDERRVRSLKSAGAFVECYQRGVMSVVLLSCGCKDRFNFWQYSMLFKSVFDLIGIAKEEDDVNGAAIDGIADKKLENNRLQLVILEHMKDCLLHIILGVMCSSYPVKGSRPMQKLLARNTPALIVCVAGENISMFELDEVLLRAKNLATGINIYRFLSDGNADDITPEVLARFTRSLVERGHNMTMQEYVGDEVVHSLNMGLLHAVGKGSKHLSRLIHVTYTPDKREVNQDGKLLHVVLIGKGVTYDTGGLNIKPDSGMISMRMDMSGAAMVLGVLWVVVSEKLNAKVSVIVPACENAIDACSYKQGDVYLSRKGLSVEIAHTDAEGRLILADAIDFGCGLIDEKDENPVLIDCATLTGAMVVALGHKVCGYFSNSTYLAGCINEASDMTKERMWQMPLIHDVDEVLLSSKVADLSNCDLSRAAGAIYGAMFLKRFLSGDNVKWAHWDIAGVASTKQGSAESTGFGVYTLFTVIRMLLKNNL